ncbi:hypothetical protein [Streptomyces sp. Z26]|uniref:hypothetical protein n=1 Tax=Streptomyces sp. Z26 TaxID=2500177 RepID=UPI001404D165|nr:hypothetical protein [Streptomyces sp. Z26]
MTTTPQQHLQTIIDRWTDLTDTLPAPTTVAPYGLGLHAYLAALDAYDAEEVAARRALRIADRADRPYDALGERPVPIRLTTLDTMRAVEAVLLDCADQIASAIQRPAASALPAVTGDDVGLQLRLLAAKDAADRSRWSWTDPATRTAPYAAVWLRHRLDGVSGPFAPLSALHRDQVTRVARGTAQRVEETLGLQRSRRALTEPCPRCRGRLEIHGGDGQPPVVECCGCGWKRTDNTVAA